MFASKPVNCKCQSHSRDQGVMFANMEVQSICPSISPQTRTPELNLSIHMWMEAWLNVGGGTRQGSFSNYSQSISLSGFIRWVGVTKVVFCPVMSANAVLLIPEAFLSQKNEHNQLVTHTQQQRGKWPVFVWMLGLWRSKLPMILKSDHCLTIFWFLSQS